MFLVRDRFCRSGAYKYPEPMKFMGTKLMGKTLGIIGFGRIGQHLAKIAKYGFNMKILYNDIVSHTEAEDF
jgi:lactate dehydrogenase-like 2-hydroxyacid dehydrogenase